MSCTNCFNGCSDITSDQCVKYTGVDITSLGITNGDPLTTVISQLSLYLIDAMDGSGITPDIDDTCALIAGYLGEGTTLNDFISALIQASCSLQTQITAVKADITTLNANYTVDCLTGVVAADDTHAVLQAVITKLCSVDDTLTALAITVDTNYVKIVDLNSLIASYMSSLSTSSLMSSRMVPYAALPFFAPDSYMSGKFDSTGAGIGAWANVYLCNGQNGTPDMRGRVPVCALQGMSGLGYNDDVNPGTSTNPNYTLNDIQGANAVTFTNVNQMPSHTHVATVLLDDPTHTHYTISSAKDTTTLPSSSNYTCYAKYSNGNESYVLRGSTTIASWGLTSAKSTGITVQSATNSYVGGSASHNNIQPVIACYYIMYRP